MTRDALAPLLCIYEGCGRAYFGEAKGTNAVQLHRFYRRWSGTMLPDVVQAPGRGTVRSLPA